MARVHCTLPNASEEISGVAFAHSENGMLSEEIDDAVARRFARIPGYRLVESPGEDGADKPRGRGRPRKAQPEGDAA